MGLLRQIVQFIAGTGAPALISGGSAAVLVEPAEKAAAANSNRSADAASKCT